MGKRLSLSILCLLTSTAGRAQETLTLDTITVKGTKEEKGYLSNTESVSIFQENELPTAGRESDLKALNGTPNFEVNKNGESFSIRGVSNTGVTGFQKDNLSSVVIDNVFQTDLAIQSGSFDLWNMERVEVLRGAQSTAQGVNSLAGSVLLNHHQPQLSNYGTAKVGAGSFGHKEAGVMTNAVLVENSIAANLSYNKDMSDGYIKNIATNNKKWGAWNKDRFGLGLVYRLSEFDRIAINTKYHRNKQGGTYTQGTDAFRYEVDENHDFEIVTSNIQSAVEYERVISEKTTNLISLAYSASDQSSRTDADGSAQDIAGVRNETREDSYLSLENRLNYKGERFTNMVGVHVHDFHLEEDYAFRLLFPVSRTAITPLAVTQAVERNRKTYALFDSFTFQMADNHSLLGGLRAETVVSEFGTNVGGTREQDLGATANSYIDNYVQQIAGDYKGNNDDLVFLPKAGYLFVYDKHHFGVTYTRGYRTSGVSINRRRASAVSYGPEFTGNYELSYKFNEGGFYVGTNVFYTDWRKQQVQVQLTNDFYDTQVQNAARSELYGAEFETSLSFKDSHNLKLGIGYVDTQFKKFETNGMNYKGKKFPFASNWTGSFAHNFRVIEDLNLLSTVRYLSSSYSNAENTRKSDAQFYLNLSARYALNEWLFEAYINNVLNGRYRIFDGTPTSTTSTYQVSYHQTSTPRQFGARVNYFW